MFAYSDVVNFFVYVIVCVCVCVCVCVWGVGGGGQGEERGEHFGDKSEDFM